VGVNGVGKTTTLGKLAYLSSKSNYKTLIAAADTFRAAAVEQLKVWGDRSNVDVISNQSKNADPAAVVFDAINSAKKRNVDLLLVDTAGRLQTKNNLMDELAKIKKIIDNISVKNSIKKGILMKSLRVAFFGCLSGPDLIQSWELFSEKKSDITLIERCLI